MRSKTEIISLLTQTGVIAVVRVEKSEQVLPVCEALAAGDGATLKAVAFRAADRPLGRALLERRGGIIHAAGVLSVDQWQGRRTATLRLLDIAEPVPAGI